MENMNKAAGSSESPMSDNNNQKVCKMCGHGMCFCVHRFFWLRLVLGLIILAIVFFVGVKVGEFKSGFGRMLMMRSGSYNMMYRSGRPMMRAYPMGMMGSGGTGSMMRQSTSTPATAMPQ